MPATIGCGPRAPSRDRIEQALVLARALATQSQTLCRETVVLRDHALVIRLQREADRGRCSLAPPALRGFTACGYVEDERVEATYCDGHLRATESLQERAHVLVAMGETFESSERSPLRATVVWPPDAVLLTVLRAMTRVQMVELLLPRQRRGGCPASDGDSTGPDATTSK